MSVTRKQHVLSATLQRRWVDETGKVADCKVGSRPSLRVVKPERTGFVVDYLPRSVANDAEAIWRSVEDLVPEALDDCASGHPSGESLETVADLAALHLARSHRSKDDWDKAMAVGFDDSGIEALLAEPGTGQAFFEERTGLIAAGSEAASLGVGFARERMQGQLDRAQLAEFAKRFDDTHIWMRSLPSVLRKTESPLYIGDDPVVLFNEAGLVRAPGQAAWLMMPVGPFHLFEWPHPGHEGVVDADLGLLLNSAQVRNARDRVIARPQDKDSLLQSVTEFGGSD